MKNVLSMVIAAMLLLVSASCSDAKDELAREVSAGNRMCPFDVGVGVASSMKYDRGANKVTLQVVVDEKILPYEDFDADLAKENVALFLFDSQDKDSRDFAKMLDKAGSGFYWELEFPRSKKTETRGYTVEEIRNHSTRKMSDSERWEQVYRNFLNSEKKSEGFTEDGCTITRVADEDGYMTFSFEYTDIDASDTDIEAFCNAMKDELRQELSDSSNDGECEAVYKTGRGMRYIYTFQPKGKTFTITFENSEIPH